MSRARAKYVVAAVGAALTMSACSQYGAPPVAKIDSEPTAEPSSPAVAPTHPRPITLAFAGDSHFELHLTDLFENPAAGLGPIDRVLSDADVTVLNLESAIATRGVPEAKELETPDDRYWFRTAPEALDVLARERSINLGLFDVNMPVLNGEELVTRIRADETMASLPVVIVSTEGSAERIERFRRLGASFIRKPFGPEALVDAIVSATSG